MRQDNILDRFDAEIANLHFLGFIHPHGKTLAQIQAEVDTYL